MPLDTAKKLREVFDSEGQDEFETAAQNIMFACAALIQHVSGPSKLQAVLDAIPNVITDNAATLTSAMHTIAEVGQRLLN